MKVGVTIWFQNMADMQERAMEGVKDRPMPRSDFDCLQDDFALCDLVEPLGFDKLWTIEHHCSPYGMTVTPAQIFSYNGQHYQIPETSIRPQPYTAELEATVEAIRSASLNVGAFGPPEEVLETLLGAQEAKGFGELICQMSYGMMPREWATESMTLFSEEVLPTLKALETPSTHSTPYAEVDPLLDRAEIRTKCSDDGQDRVFEI